jgi:hypothetical protein
LGVSLLEIADGLGEILQDDHMVLLGWHREVRGR